MISWILVIFDEYYDATTDENEIVEHKTCGLKSSRRCDWSCKIIYARVSTNLLDTDIVVVSQFINYHLQYIQCERVTKEQTIYIEVAFYSG